MVVRPVPDVSRAARRAANELASRRALEAAGAMLIDDAGGRGRCAVGAILKVLRYSSKIDGWHRVHQW
jgi:hypothetical protein